MSASPSAALATQRPDLRESFMEFDLEANQARLVGRNILTTIDVGVQAGKFGRIPLNQLLMKRDTLRAPRGGYSRQDWTFTPDTWATEENGAEEPIDDRESAMYANYFSQEVISTKRAMSALMINQESRIATALFNTGTFDNNAAAAKWDVTSDPPAQIDTVMQNIYNKSGLWPDTLVISLKAYRALLNNDAIIDRVKYQGFVDARLGALTKSAIAQAMGIENIEVAMGLENTANDPAAASLDPIWTETIAGVYKVARSNDPVEPGVGRCFHWSADGSQVEGLIETYRSEEVRADIVRVRHDTNEKIMYAEAGELLTAVV